MFNHTHIHTKYNTCTVFSCDRRFVRSKVKQRHTHTHANYIQCSLCVRIESKRRRNHSIHYFIELKFKVKKNSDDDDSWEEETKRKPVLGSYRSGIIIRLHACVCVRVTILFIYFQRSIHRKFTHKMWRSTKVERIEYRRFRRPHKQFYGFMKKILLLLCSVRADRSKLQRSFRSTPSPPPSSFRIDCNNWIHYILCVCVCSNSRWNRINKNKNARVEWMTDWLPLRFIFVHRYMRRTLLHTVSAPQTCTALVYTCFIESAHISQSLSHSYFPLKDTRAN